MYSIWTKHLKDKEDKDKFEASIKHSKWVLDRLDIVLDEMQRNVEATEISAKVYDKPNWSHWQAHHNGYKNCIQSIKKLINLDQKETHDRPIT